MNARSRDISASPGIRAVRRYREVRDGRIQRLVARIVCPSVAGSHPWAGGQELELPVPDREHDVLIEHGDAEPAPPVRPSDVNWRVVGAM